MNAKNVLFSLAFLILINVCSYAQLEAGYHSFLFPHSVKAAALGEQGVASRSALDAMQYNPAALVYSDSLSISYFRNPLYKWGLSMPISSVNASMKLGKYGNIGVEYTNYDWGEYEVATIEHPDGTGQIFKPYERSFALGYAINISKEVAVGAELRYAWQDLEPNITFDNNILFSAGVSYRPEIFSDRINFGLSLVNFGSQINYHSGGISNSGLVIERQSGSSPLPSMLNIGLEGLAVTNNFFDLGLSLGAAKPLVKMDGVISSQSSFKSLFNDWGDFPRDASAQIGLGFLWRPINIGAGISYIQEMYAGYYTRGPYESYTDYFTHGFKVGLDVCGTKATIGYAGIWHSHNVVPSYLSYKFPLETFQFSLSTDMNLFRKKKEEAIPQNRLNKTILSFGYSFGLVTGRMKEMSVVIDEEKLSSDNNNDWQLEADFYMNEKSALFSAFTYSHMTQTFGYRFSDKTPYYNIDMEMETVSLESGYRYHPINSFKPFFVQASLGIIRMNPILATNPRYFYYSFDRIAAGCLITAEGTGIVLMPKIGLRTIFTDFYFSSSSLSGNNQIEFSLNLGYAL